MSEVTFMHITSALFYSILAFMVRDIAKSNLKDPPSRWSPEYTKYMKMSAFSYLTFWIWPVTLVVLALAYVVPAVWKALKDTVNWAVHPKLGRQTKQALAILSRKS